MPIIHNLSKYVNPFWAVSRQSCHKKKDTRIDWCQKVQEFLFFLYFIFSSCPSILEGCRAVKIMWTRQKTAVRHNKQSHLPVLRETCKTPVLVLCSFLHSCTHSLRDGWFELTSGNCHHISWAMYITRPTSMGPLAVYKCLYVHRTQRNLEK